MKKFFIFGLFLCFSGSLFAQSLDDLFDESDFSSEPASEEKETKPASLKPVEPPASGSSTTASAAGTASSFAAPSPAASPDRPQQASQPPASAPEPSTVGSKGIPMTFDVPQTSPSALTLPYSGRSSAPAETIAPATGAGLLSRLAADSPAPDLPMLGARAKAKKRKTCLCLNAEDAKSVTAISTSNLLTLRG